MRNDYDALLETIDYAIANEVQQREVDRKLLDTSFENLNAIHSDNHTNNHNRGSESNNDNSNNHETNRHFEYRNVNVNTENQHENNYENTLLTNLKIVMDDVKIIKRTTGNIQQDLSDRHQHEFQNRLDRLLDNRNNNRENDNNYNNNTENRNNNLENRNDNYNRRNNQNENNTHHKENKRSYCRLYLSGPNCPHGLTGKNCAKEHPKKCYNWMYNGSCNSHENEMCPFLHPNLCNIVNQRDLCDDPNCDMYHVKGTHDTNAYEHQKYKSNQNYQYSNNPKYRNFERRKRNFNNNYEYESANYNGRTYNKKQNYNHLDENHYYNENHENRHQNYKENYQNYDENYQKYNEDERHYRKENDNTNFLGELKNIKEKMDNMEKEKINLQNQLLQSNHQIQSIYANQIHWANQHQTFQNPQQRQVYINRPVAQNV